jgi:hypothetical protein
MKMYNKTAQPGLAAGARVRVRVKNGTLAVVQ